MIIHTQIPLEILIGFKLENPERYNITIIEKTVSAPGLYYMGDVYVYPTTLDGLGLTMYEALASGMPVITTNCPPMNEVITNDVGKLVDIEKYKTRWDAYYWPLAFVKKESLIEAMKYYVDNSERILEYRNLARKVAEEKWNWKDRVNVVSNAFTESKIKKIPNLNDELKKYTKKEIKKISKDLLPFIPKWVQEIIFHNR